MKRRYSSNDEMEKTGRYNLSFSPSFVALVDAEAAKRKVSRSALIESLATQVLADGLTICKISQPGTDPQMFWVERESIDPIIARYKALHGGNFTVHVDESPEDAPANEWFIYVSVFFPSPDAEDRLRLIESIKFEKLLPVDLSKYTQKLV